MQILLILPFRNLEPPLIKTTYNGLQFISSDHGKPTTSDTRSHLFKARVALWMMACKSPSWWTCPGASHSLCLILMIDFNTWKDPFPLFEDAKMLPELQKEDQKRTAIQTRSVPAWASGNQFLLLQMSFSFPKSEPCFLKLEVNGFPTCLFSSRRSHHCGFLGIHTNPAMTDHHQQRVRHGG